MRYREYTQVHELLGRKPKFVPGHVVTKMMLWTIDPLLSISHGLLNHATDLQHFYICLEFLESKENLNTVHVRR